MKNEQDVNGLTPLSNAVLSQDLSKIMSLLAQNLDLEVEGGGIEYQIPGSDDILPFNMV